MSGFLICPSLGGGHFGIALSVRPSVCLIESVRDSSKHVAGPTLTGADGSDGAIADKTASRATVGSNFPFSRSIRSRKPDTAGTDDNGTFTR